MVPSTTTPAGRVAVVTGSNKGIGFFIALQMATSGLFRHVILACRDEARGQKAAQQIQNELGHKQVKVKYTPLTLGDHTSHVSFRDKMEREFGKVDVLVNNAAIGYFGGGPPFKQQTKPTLDINYRGTVDLTEELLPLIRKGEDPRIVNVSSMLGRLGQLESRQLRDQFTSNSLTIPELSRLVDSFEADVQAGTHKQKGWGNSNYGLSKLAVIAATRVWARENPSVKINSCCPGYCRTDMTYQQGMRDPKDGAKNAVLPATMENPPTGALFSDYKVSKW